MTTTITAPRPPGVLAPQYRALTVGMVALITWSRSSPSP
jgi:hypothetical protein